MANVHKKITQQNKYKSLGKKKKICYKHIPNPAVSTNIRITFPVCSKTWALTTTALTFGTVATSEMVLAHLRTTKTQNISQ